MHSSCVERAILCLLGYHCALDDALDHILLDFCKSVDKKIVDVIINVAKKRRNQNSHGFFSLFNKNAFSCLVSEF
jgi:hypothetical protein